eukprot:m.139660 g.139660  ORF g.139660 m.139660 type:complete len:202 (+) comp17635_c0_seq1:176-781(+)
MEGSPSNVNRRRSTDQEREELSQKLMDALKYSAKLPQQPEQIAPSPRKQSVILEPQSPSKSYGRRENQDLISYRIFDVNAIKAPGVLYKSVIVHPDMDSLSLIREALDKFGSSADAREFSLHYAVDYPDDIPKKHRKDPPKVLDHEECPLLVAEWYTDLPRRFEIHRRASDEAKLQKKWSKYWHSPIKQMSIRRKRPTGSS